MVREILPPSTALAYEAMRALRPQLGDEAAFVRRVDEVQRPEGYRLVGEFEDDRDEAVAVAGFRLGHSLVSGHYLYVDDLSTLPDARRRGHARRLLDWLLEEGARQGCDELQLDSAVGPQRGDAHRLYLNAGFQIDAHHFTRAVDRRP
jgi:GNAT superfamily N-acetyltransferase